MSNPEDSRLVMMCDHSTYESMKSCEEFIKSVYSTLNGYLRYFRNCLFPSKTNNLVSPVYETSPLSLIFNLFYKKIVFIFDAIDLVYFSYQIFNLTGSSLTRHRIRDTIYKQMYTTAIFGVISLFTNRNAGLTSYDHVYNLFRVLDLVKVAIVISIWLINLSRSIGRNKLNMEKKQKECETEREKYNIYYAYGLIYSLIIFYFVGFYVSAITNSSSPFLRYINITNNLLLALFYIIVDIGLLKAEPEENAKKGKIVSIKHDCDE